LYDGYEDDIEEDWWSWFFHWSVVWI